MEIANFKGEIRKNEPMSRHTSFAIGGPADILAYPADRDNHLYEHTELEVSLEAVKANFARYGLLDDQVVFVEGLFSDTLPKLEAGPFALIRLDGDMYESTILALQHLLPKVSPGGFVIIDDYGVQPECRQAVQDFRAQHRIEAPMHQIDRSGVWWRHASAPAH